jgi:hypothetical protein
LNAGVVGSAKLICAVELAVATLLSIMVLAYSLDIRIAAERPPIAAVCELLAPRPPQDSGERDLATYCASLRSAMASEQQANLALLSVLLLAATLLPTAAAALYTARQVALGRRSLVLEHRPWVLIESVALVSDLRFSPEGARLEFTFVARNVGRTPARGVTFSPKLHIDWRVPAGQAQRDLAATLRGRPRTWGLTMFPSEQRTFRSDIGIGKEEWERHFQDMNEVFPETPRVEIFSLALIGSVAYGSLLGDEVHQTGFAFDIRRKQFVDHQGHPSVAIGPALGDVPQDDLELQLPWSDVLTD